MNYIIPQLLEKIKVSSFEGVWADMLELLNFFSRWKGDKIKCLQKAAKKMYYFNRSAIKAFAWAIKNFQSNFMQPITFRYCKDFEKIPARQLLAPSAYPMATVFFRYLYSGGYGGGTGIDKTGIGAVFDFCFINNRSRLPLQWSYPVPLTLNSGNHL